MDIFVSVFVLQFTLKGLKFLFSLFVFVCGGVFCGIPLIPGQK